MKALLTCPDQCPALSTLTQRKPLALLPICGTPLLHLFIRDLAARGATDIVILASDRPAEVRDSVEGGVPWGVAARVIPTPAESALDNLRREWRPATAAGWMEPPCDMQVVDHLPGIEPKAPISDAASYHAACRAFIALAREHQIGFTEPEPGCVVSRAARVARRATLRAPCWIGDNAVIEAGARIGPGGVIENDSIVGENSEINESIVGSNTYVGASTTVRHSIVSGSSLQNYLTGTRSTIIDRVLLADVPKDGRSRLTASWVARLAAVFVVAATAPVLPLAWMQARIHRRPMFERLHAVAPPTGQHRRPTIAYRQFTGFQGYWKRWPELWNIVRGEFSWVGNRPLTPRQRDLLETEFDRLWLEAPIGMFSLEDAQGPRRFLDAESRAHASYYSVFRGFVLDCNILCRILLRE